MDQVKFVEDILYKIWRDMVRLSLSRPYHFKFLKGCLPQILLCPFLNTLSHIFDWALYKSEFRFVPQISKLQFWFPNPFLANVLIWHILKTSKNLWFSTAFQGSMKWEPGPEIDDQKGKFKYMKLVSTLEKRLITSAVKFSI